MSDDIIFGVPGKTAHNLNVLAAHNVRAQAYKAGVGNQAAIRTADAVFFRSMISSCVANGVGADVFRQALWEITGQFS
jgi:hypothetical protein